MKKKPKIRIITKQKPKIITMKGLAVTEIITTIACMRSPLGYLWD
jgi:hypothetical protein